jgi:PAS domain S-box-containing protein
MPEQNAGPDTIAGLHGAILDALPLAVLVYNDELILYANDMAREALGATSLEQLVGQPVDKLMHPELFDTSPMRRRVQLETRQTLRNLHVKAQRLDGTELKAVIDTAVIDTDDGPALCAICRCDEQ